MELKRCMSIKHGRRGYNIRTSTQNIHGTRFTAVVYFLFNWNAFHTKPWFKSKVEVVLVDSGKKIMKGHRSFLTLKIC